VAEPAVTTRATATSLAGRLAGVRRLAVVPAYNEAAAIGLVIAEIRAADSDFDIVVIDDGSTDRTAEIAAEAGAHVVCLPYNLGIGGAVQTGYQYARDHEFQIAVQIDGDGQHDPKEVPKLLGPLVDGTADMVIGTRFGQSEGYRGPRTRRLGMRIFAFIVSLIVRQRVTDTTSGFRAVNRRGIILFAADYPHDYPEVEATVLVFKHRLRMVEVSVSMRERTGGRSSITALRSFYYMVKVSLALFVSLFRHFSTPLEDQ
jgi:glycosyltransferase involved in cell wall biosynthesis